MVDVQELQAKLKKGGFDTFERVYIAEAIRWISEERPTKLQAKIGAHGMHILDLVVQNPVVACE